MKNLFKLKVSEFCSKKLNLFRPTSRGRFIMACLSLLALGNLNAQNSKNAVNNTKTSPIEGVVIKGNVSENSNPLPDVNILLEGTIVGTRTDEDGNFTFPKKLKKGDVLLFSYIGYKSQKVVIDEKTMDLKVALKLDLELEEIVIYGAAASKKVYRSKGH